VGKKWHTNKTKPKAYEEILVIIDTGEIYTDMITQDDCGRRRFVGWEDVKMWQYTDKLFKKELEQIRGVK